jgi:hypothetical protein
MMVCGECSPHVGRPGCPFPLCFFPSFVFRIDYQMRDDDDQPEKNRPLDRGSVHEIGL